MLDRWSSAPGIMDRNQIKPVLVLGVSVPEHPHRCHPREVSLLPPADRLEGGSADGGAASLHLHKRDRPAFPDDEVEIVPPELEAMGFDRPATGREERDGDPFSVYAEQLATVLPFLDRNEAAGAGHGPR